MVNLTPASRTNVEMKQMKGDDLVKVALNVKLQQEGRETEVIVLVGNTSWAPGLGF